MEFNEWWAGRTEFSIRSSAAARQLAEDAWNAAVADREERIRVLEAQLTGLLGEWRKRGARPEEMGGDWNICADELQAALDAKGEADGR